MLELFTGDNPIKAGLLHYPEFDYIRRTYVRQIGTIVNYYQSRVYAVKNQHILVRLLNTLDVPMRYDVENYTRVAGARAPYVANGFRFTSPLCEGDIHEGCFYGPGSKEIIISNCEIFDPYHAAKNWKTICAVQPLLHQKSDLKVLLPNGKRTMSGDGLSVISVNIPLLALQYKCFCEDQAAQSAQSGSLLGVTHFIHMYVLPNMLYQHFDIAIMNRLMNIYYGKPMGEVYARHAFNVIDYTDKVDGVLEKVVDRAKVTPIDYEWLLESIPTVTSDDMKEALMLPDLAPTRQVYWALMLSRLGIMRFILDMTKERSLTKNRGYLNHLQRKLIRLQRENIYFATLPVDMYHDVEWAIEDIMKL